LPKNNLKNPIREYNCCPKMELEDKPWIILEEYRDRPYILQKLHYEISLPISPREPYAYLKVYRFLKRELTPLWKIKDNLS